MFAPWLAGAVPGIKHGGAGWHRVRVGRHHGPLARLHKATGDLVVLSQPFLSLRLQVVSLLAEPLGHGLSELRAGVLKVNLVHSLGFISLALSTSQVEVSLPSFWWRRACIAPGRRGGRSGVADRGAGPGGQHGRQSSGDHGVVRLQLLGGLDGVRRERVGGVRGLRSGAGRAGPGPGAVRSGRRSRRSSGRTGAGPVWLHRALEIFMFRSGQVMSGQVRTIEIQYRNTILIL